VRCRKPTAQFVGVVLGAEIEDWAGARPHSEPELAE